MSKETKITNFILTALTKVDKMLYNYVIQLLFANHLTYGKGPGKEEIEYI